MTLERVPAFNHITHCIYIIISQDFAPLCCFLILIFFSGIKDDYIWIYICIFAECDCFAYLKVNPFCPFVQIKLRQNKISPWNHDLVLKHLFPATPIVKLCWQKTLPYSLSKERPCRARSAEGMDLHFTVCSVGQVTIKHVQCAPAKSWVFVHGRVVAQGMCAPLCYPSHESYFSHTSLFLCSVGHDHCLLPEPFLRHVRTRHTVLVGKCNSQWVRSEVYSGRTLTSKFPIIRKNCWCQVDWYNFHLLKRP